MRRHVIVLLLGIVLLLVPFLSCVPPAATAATPSDGIAYKSDITALRADLTTKADKSVVDTLSNLIGKQTAGVAPNNTYTDSQLYTKTEVEAAIAKAILDLKTAAPWGTVATAANNNSIATATGTVQFTTNPVSIPQIFSSSSGGNSSPWIMTISNQTTTWQYVKPVLSLNVASGQASSLVSAITVMTSGGACSMTGTFPTPVNNFSFSPITMNTIVTPSLVIIPISGCNGSGEIQVGPGTQQAFNIQIQGLITPNPTLWNITCSISARSM